MSNFCTETLTVHGLAENLLEELVAAIYAADKPDCRYAFGEEVPYKQPDGDIYFGSYNDINYGISTNELIDLSRQFPDAIFTLDGRDDIGELYRVYYQNGGSYSVSAEITYPPFDPSQLIYPEKMPDLKTDPGPRSISRRISQLGSGV